MAMVKTMVFCMPKFPPIPASRQKARPCTWASALPRKSRAKSSVIGIPASPSREVDRNSENLCPAGVLRGPDRRLRNPAPSGRKPRFPFATRYRFCALPVNLPSEAGNRAQRRDQSPVGRPIASDRRRCPQCFERRSAAPAEILCWSDKHEIKKHRGPLMVYNSGQWDRLQCDTLQCA